MTLFAKWLLHYSTTILILLTKILQVENTFTLFVKLYQHRRILYDLICYKPLPYSTILILLYKDSSSWKCVHSICEIVPTIKEVYQSKYNWEHLCSIATKCSGTTIHFHVFDQLHWFADVNFQMMKRWLIFTDSLKRNKGHTGETLAVLKMLLVMLRRKYSN